jgi:hypothetical protein
LTDHLCDYTGATAAYIGQVAKPIKGVSQGLPEHSLDEDHLLPQTKDEIQFISG